MNGDLVETYTQLLKIQKEYILHYKKYTYPKEKIREYTRNYYLKNKEKIVARSTAYLKDKYRTDPEFKERAKGYSKAYRDRQQLLIQEARKIVLANEAKQKVAYSTIYNE